MSNGSMLRFDYVEDVIGRLKEEYRAEVDSIVSDIKLYTSDFDNGILVDYVFMRKTIPLDIRNVLKGLTIKLRKNINKLT